MSDIVDLTVSISKDSIKKKKKKTAIVGVSISEQMDLSGQTEWVG